MHCIWVFVVEYHISYALSFSLSIHLSINVIEIVFDSATTQGSTGQYLSVGEAYWVVVLVVSSYCEYALDQQFSHLYHHLVLHAGLWPIACYCLSKHFLKAQEAVLGLRLIPLASAGPSKL